MKVNLSLYKIQKTKKYVNFIGSFYFGFFCFVTRLILAIFCPHFLFFLEILYHFLLNYQNQFQRRPRGTSLQNYLLKLKIPLKLKCPSW